MTEESIVEQDRLHTADGFSYGSLSKFLYSISDEYITFLRKKFSRVYSNKENTRVHTRKYLGAVIEVNQYKYYIPLSFPKIKNAKLLYSKRKSKQPNRVVQNCLDFVTLEKECDVWTKQQPR